MWKRLSTDSDGDGSLDIPVGVANNSTKIIGVNSVDTLVAVTSEDLVRIAISSSNDVKNVFNTQLSTAISNDGDVQDSFNTQVSTAITTVPAVQNALTTTVNNVNNTPGSTITYQNPPTVNGQPLLVLPTSENDGDHLMYDGMGTTDVSAKKLLVKASAAERTQLVNFGQASSQQRTAASFQEILDTFYRFSHNGNNDHAGTNVGGVNLEQGWVIDNNNNLTQPANWTGALGFASQILYDTYEGSVLLRSDHSWNPTLGGAGDNDLLGFVLCLCQTDENGTAIGDETISVVRTNEYGAHSIPTPSLPGGGTDNSQKFAIVYNLQQSNQTTLAWDSTGTYPDKTDWQSIYPNGDAIKYKRSRDRIEVWLIQNVAQPPPLDDPSWDAGNYISVDLTVANNGVSAAALAKFREPARWGLVASSQGECSWANLLFNGVNEGGLSLNPKPDPAINNMVFDVESGTTWVWNNGAWVPDPQGRTIHDYVDSGQILLDTASGSLYVKDNGELQLLQSKRMQGVELTANSGITVNDIGKLVVACPGCNTLTFDGNYGIGWHCAILNKSGGILNLTSSGITRFGDRTSGQPNTTISISDGDGCIARGNGHNGGANLHTNIQDGRYGTAV